MRETSFESSGKALRLACAMLLALLLVVLLAPPAAASEAASSRVTFSVRPSVRMLPDGSVLSNVPTGTLHRDNILTAFPL